MTLLGMEGFDNSRVPSGFSTSSNAGVQFVAGRATNSKALDLRHGFTNIGSSTSSCTWVFSALADGYAGVAAQWTGSSGAANTVLFALMEGGTVHLYMTLNSTGHLEVRRGDGTVLGATTFTVSLSGWSQYTFDWIIADSGGYIALWYNGFKVIEYTGDTRNGGTVGTVDRVRLLTSTQSANSGSLYVDDFYRGDHAGTAPYNAPLGDCQVMPLRPDGNGAVNQWVGSDGDSVNNYQHVDDVSTTTDYVGSATVGNKDLYTASDLDAPALGVTQTVMAVQAEILAAKSAAGTTGSINGVVRSGSSGTETEELLATAAALTTSYQWFVGGIQVTDPDGAAWTPASANAVQIGVKVA